MAELRRRASLIGVVALLVLAGWWLLRPAPIPVEVAAVRRGPLRVTVDEEGETRVRERYTIAAATTGRLLRVAVDEGDLVEANAVVATIQPAPLDPRDLAGARARLEAAEDTQSAAVARVRRAEAAHDKSRRDAQRAEELFRAGTLSADARERAK